MEPANKVKEKIERLVDRLVEQRVVPFLGAGASIEAIHKSNNKKIADTKYLIKKVAFNIYKMRHNGEDDKKCWSKWCLGSSNLLNTSLDRLCEMYLWLSQDQDVKNLVKNVLRIDEFINLNPTPAHRYIAFLAREELIDEVITTNYDTCLEKAYLDTFQQLDHETDKTPACVVDYLNDYRENAGKVYVQYKGKERRCLKIYKINGCAKRFSKDESTANNILLTEYQLQDWRQRHWACDLFRDRLRSRTIVFSGFGSDEPQVRYTALQVMEEFQDKGKSPEKESDSSWWKLPNAPYIAAYEKTLSFNQIQILSAFIKAHGESLTFEEVHRNAFTGNDTTFFGCDGRGLTADVFWKRVFQVTFWRILKNYCAQDSSAFNYLSAVVPSAEALLQEMLEWIAPGDRLFGRFPELLTIEKGNNCIPLSLWVWPVRYRYSMLQNGGWYAPLKERPVLIPILFLILHLVVGEEICSWGELNDLVSTEKNFFKLKMPKDGLNVFVAHQEKAFRDQETVELPEDFNQVALVQVIISNSSMEAAQRKRIKIYNTKDPADGKMHEIRMVSVYQIPFRELFRSEYTEPYSAHKARAVFRESLLQSFLMIDRARPRLRHRAKQI